MKRADSVRRSLGTAGLAVVFLAASPAIKAAGSSGLALAADTPPAVAQPDGAASKPASTDSTTAEAGKESSDLSYHREAYAYASSSLRDPFSSLISGRFVSDAASRLPDIGSVELLGVMWGESDRFAMLEDKEGQGYVLRIGDPVVNGEVSAITRDSITIRQYFFGTSTTVTLKLKPREGNDAKRSK